MVESTRTKPTKTVFEPNEQMGIIITCKNYEKCKVDNPSANNVPSSEQDGQVMMNVMKQRLHISEDKIAVLQDPSHEQIKNAYKQLKDTFKAVSQSEGARKLMCWVYFSGNGYMCNENLLYLNEEAKKDRYFNLENHLEILCEFCKDTACVFFFDACREAVPKQEMRGDSEVTTKTIKPVNFICCSACKPNGGVPLVSTYAQSIDNLLQDTLEENGGILNLPQDLHDLTFYNQGAEMRSVACEHIKLNTN